MSLQRVLETARKMGVPVIVTDSAGLDPIVILPLEQFEAMSREKDDRRKTVDDSIIGNDFSLSKASNSTDEIPIEDRFYLEPIDGNETIDNRR